MTGRTALVLDGGSGPALAVVRSLGRAGWRVVVGEATRSARSRYASDTVALLDDTSPPARSAELLRSAVERVQPDVVVPCTDASVELVWQTVDRGRALTGHGPHAVALLDKAETLRLADGQGFPTPNWVAPESVTEAASWLAANGLPAVVKPRRSYRLVGDRLDHVRHWFVTDSAQLERVLLAGAEPDGRLPVLQQLVPGRSLAVSAVRQRGRVLGWAARETLSFHPVQGGTSVWKRTIAPDDAGVQAALGLLAALEYEGIGEVEYQVGAEGPALMEVGVRMHGWVPLAVLAGVDLPLLAATALLDDDVDTSPPFRVGVQMRWPAGEAARVRRALRHNADLPPGVTRRSVLARAWPPWSPRMRYDGVDLDDPGPWLPEWVCRARDAATRRAVKSAPSTNRDSGPKRPSAG